MNSVKVIVMSREFIPALRFHWLTGLYDPIIALTTRESVFKDRLIELANFRYGARVLDVGCGTGTLAIRLKQKRDDVVVSGIDGDNAVLARAKKKAAKFGVNIQFDQGLSFALPYADATYDQIVSTLFFHHLLWDDKIATLKEALRVLKPGGHLHIADWGKATSPMMRILFYGVQLLDGFKTTADNVEGRLPEAMRRLALLISLPVKKYQPCSEHWLCIKLLSFRQLSNSSTWT